MIVAKYGEAILPIQLEVTDRDAGFAAVKRAHEYFERLDVIVNNAGYGQFGMVEEISEQEIRAQLETRPPAARAPMPRPSGPRPRGQLV